MTPATSMEILLGKILPLGAVFAFDVVLIDCPPNLYQCSWNAMLAAEHVLIPIPPEDFGTQGIRAVHQAIANARVLKFDKSGKLLAKAIGTFRLLQERK